MCGLQCICETCWLHRSPYRLGKRVKSKWTFFFFLEWLRIDTVACILNLNNENTFPIYAHTSHTVIHITRFPHCEQGCRVGAEASFWKIFLRWPVPSIWFFTTIANTVVDHPCLVKSAALLIDLPQSSAHDKMTRIKFWGKCSRFPGLCNPFHRLQKSQILTMHTLTCYDATAGTLQIYEMRYQLAQLVLAIQELCLLAITFILPLPCIHHISNNFILAETLSASSERM